MEYNELKQEERIKEFENAQGDLIFECFQDEVSWVLIMVYFLLTSLYILIIRYIILIV